MPRTYGKRGVAACTCNLSCPVVRRQTEYHKLKKSISLVNATYSLTSTCLSLPCLLGLQSFLCGGRGVICWPSPPHRQDMVSLLVVLGLALLTGLALNLDIHLPLPSQSWDEECSTTPRPPHKDLKTRRRHSGVECQFDGCDFRLCYPLKQAGTVKNLALLLQPILFRENTGGRLSVNVWLNYSPISQSTTAVFYHGIFNAWTHMGCLSNLRLKLLPASIPQPRGPQESQMIREHTQILTLGSWV